MTDLTNDFLDFAWHSLTPGQQDIITVKFHIFENMDKTVKELQEQIEQLDLNESFYRSSDRIRKIKKYEIPLIYEYKKRT